MKDEPKPSQGKGYRGPKNWKAAAGLSLVILLLAAFFWGAGELGTPPNVHASKVTIKALHTDKLGVDLDSPFVLTSSEPLSEKTITTALHINPQFSYTLDKQTGGLEYKIIPQEQLTANTIYTLTFDPNGSGQENLSWAFQTKGEFRVINALPRRESTHVPISTGIEITFSHDSYEIDTLKDYFSISPHVEGTFEKHKKTLVFVPKGLEPSTIYTVALKKGFPLMETHQTLAEDYIFSFETGSGSENTDQFVFDVNSELTEFSTADVPAFPAYFSNSFIPPLHIDLYRYPDYKVFQGALGQRDRNPRWSYFAWNRYRGDMNPQYKVAEYETEFLRIDDYNHYVLFPEELEAGYYVAELKAGESIRQIWFQVSDLAVYLARGEENTLFWANDLNRKAPAAHAQVTIDSRNLSTAADESGAVLIQESLVGTEQDYALVKSGNKETLIPLEPWPQWYTQDRQRAIHYWKYLYLDREIYQPEDTVHFWGVLAPRGKDSLQGQKVPAVKEASIELIASNAFYYEGDDGGPILTQTLPIQEMTYQGQLKLPVLKPGYYYLQLKSEGNVLLTRGFEVATYQKPAYKLSLSQDKRAVFVGEAMNFQVKSAFFEGTPVPGLQCAYTIQDKKGSVITDDQGEAALSFSPALNEEDYSPYRYLYLGMNAVLPEVGEIYSSGGLYVFKSKVYLTGEAKRHESGYTLKAQLSAVDLTGINAGKDFSEEHFLKESIPNQPVKGHLYQEVWTKVEAGQRYDFINKEVVKNYYYDYSVKHQGDFDLVTDAQGMVSYTGDLPEPRNSYYLELVAEDSEGHPFKKRIYIGNSGSFNPEHPYYYLQGDRGAEGYAPGEEVEVTFMMNDHEFTTEEKNLLFFRGQKFIEDYQVSAHPLYGFTFEQGHNPNLTVYGVHFDGYRYHEASWLTVPFARETKALEVKIGADQKEYRPGDTVMLELQVLDPKNQPVPGAQVNLNLVDEALFSLREQNVYFRDALYGDTIHLSLLTRKSHNHPELPGGAEQGGEGGSERKDFRDTVLFTTVVTDEQGKAKAQFQLPDNLTSWRVTYHAFTQHLQAGSGTTQIPVRLPFFIEMNVNSFFLSGDSPVVILRSFGEKLKANQKVDYKINLISGRGEEKSWTERTQSFQALDWKLPALDAGRYTLTVAAESGGLKDVLTKEFVIEDSFQARTVTSQNLLSEGVEIKGSVKEPTTVVFSDAEKSQNLEGLYRMAWSHGSRLEQKLARLEARKLLKEYFPEEEFFAEGEEQESLLNYQQMDGGISILPYGASELALSAQVASTTSGIVDERALAGYFYSILAVQEEGKDRSLALLGLAALKEPVLLLINEEYQKKDLAPEVKINLASALLEIGDGAYAEQVYQDLIKPYGEDLGATMRIKGGQDQDEIIQATTQMALLASRLNQPEKNKLYQYLLENQGKDILNLVEQIQILKYNLKFMQSAPVSFTYELYGKKEKKTLQGKEVFKLTLQPEELKTIQFSEIEGQVGIVSTYSQPIKAGETGKGEDLSISHKFLVDGQETITIKRSDLVQVVITYHIGEKAPDGLYEMIDVLPAGLTYIPRPYNYRGDSSNLSIRWSYPVEVNGQRLVFQCDKKQEQITYLARVISPGEFTAEAPVLSHITNSGIYTSGKEAKVLIE
ncbi:Ig-like domain-containing alpha-2-macroglobulin family protein [Desulfitobacterium sp. PCE1]|uniref:Ig-like domain-containing alpha-2-macroglobulin family protein n=1 Tax=Desulfitobacterium sp. PCE1 TaxID=146907 RepID=UPI000374E12E|nr:Ig-like domain-containing alpha-2-macroglobulin family protein [Desulfitobacterium sp. PCE1]